METRDWSQFIVGALKRWPRLVLLVVIVNLLSAIFAILGLYQDHSWFGASVFQPAASVIRSALVEGIFSTFFDASAGFNSALWTMHFELFGSFAAYATALVMIFQKSLPRAMTIGAIAILLTATLTGRGGVYYAMPIAGVLVARIYIERNSMASALGFMKPWQTPIVLVTAALAVVLLGYDGYSKPVGFYAFMAGFARPEMEPIVHGVAAVAILMLVLFCEPIRKALSGPTTALLGRLSFPLYLVHLPILLGLVLPIHSSLAVRCGDIVAASAAFVILIALTLMAAYPLALLDEWWVRKLRDAARPAVAGLQRRGWRPGEPPVAARPTDLPVG
jgi:peptidoglycan/LPS O-acetylase OafA/YrhL